MSKRSMTASLFEHLRRWRPLCLLVVTVGALLIAGTILIGCGSSRRGEPFTGPLSLSAKAQQGQVVFMRHCYQCHPGGEAGLGPALNDKPLPAALVKWQVRSGGGVMPSFSDKQIPDGDLDVVVDYLYAVRTSKPHRS